VSMNPTVDTQDVGLNKFPFASNFELFRVQQYVQCTNTTTSSSSTGLLTGTPATDTSGC
jgi:hypothetical protein